MTKELPSGLELVRKTPMFDEEYVPRGPSELTGSPLGYGAGWWFTAGHSSSDSRTPPGEGHVVNAGEHLAIPPERPHKIELGEGPTTFAIEFHRAPTD